MAQCACYMELNFAVCKFSVFFFFSLEGLDSVYVQISIARVASCGDRVPPFLLMYAITVVLSINSLKYLGIWASSLTKAWIARYTAFSSRYLILWLASLMLHPPSLCLCTLPPNPWSRHPSQLSYRLAGDGVLRRCIVNDLGGPPL